MIRFSKNTKTYTFWIFILYVIKDNFPIWGLCFANNIDMMGQLDMEIYRKIAADIYHLKIYNKLITM